MLGLLRSLGRRVILKQYLIPTKGGRVGIDIPQVPGHGCWRKCGSPER